ncbi:MAG: hypothetical protein CMQ19_01600 [Gammaproteobacteria bacterium]|nr:hypothetical protein [Gammaproteobacteria bacterium]
MNDVSSHYLDGFDPGSLLAPAGHRLFQLDYGLRLGFRLLEMPDQIQKYTVDMNIHINVNIVGITINSKSTILDSSSTIRIFLPMV